MKIAIVAGGTGGHLYPGLAIAKALVGQEVCFVVRRGDLGQEIISREGFPVVEISGQGLPRSLSVKWLTFPFHFLRGTIEAKSFLNSFNPDWVVGMGGYLSVPMVMLARICGLKTLIHEQNVVPGLANRLLGHFVSSIAMSFSESKAHFPTKKSWVSGLPVRSDIGQTDQTTGRRTFHLELEKRTYLVFGGSLGARQLNTFATQIWLELLKRGNSFQVVHITGKLDYSRVEKLYADLRVPVTLLPYCHDMPAAYAAADAVICRAGASTISELCLARRPALLIPYPHATNDHQYFNAKVLQAAGLGRVMRERELHVSDAADFLSQNFAKTPHNELYDSIAGAARRLAAHLTAPSS